jgi:hypothetical protein
MTMQNTLYDSDFYTWTQEQTKLLRAGKLSHLDIRHLIEEIEDLGESQARGLQSQLERLIAHLLKWEYQPHQRQHSLHSWQASINDARERIMDSLGSNPGLKPQLPELFAKSYRGAVNGAVIETNLSRSTFPVDCPYTLEQILDEAFWPEPGQAEP